VALGVQQMLRAEALLELPDVRRHLQEQASFHWQDYTKRSCWTAFISSLLPNSRWWWNRNKQQARKSLWRGDLTASAVPKSE
jgi:hypothetical protein